MKRKVNEIVKKYSEKLTGISNIEAILVNDRAANDVYDPNFTIDFDIFHKGELVTPDKRQEILENPAFFETSPVYPVDQFLVDNLPVHLNYKDINGISQVLDRITKKEWVYRKEMSSVLYRILKGQVIYSKNGWVNSTREQISGISDWFWQRVLDSTRFLLETNLQSLNLSVVTKNHLLYQTSLATIIDSISSFIFALHRQHKPSTELILSAVKTLENATSEFISWFEALIIPDSELNPEKKYEIATRLTKWINSLKLE
ncbi:MAG: hypothetical protein JXR70_06755 [Spirochaetales bacterium]|nr:hypothetical protein [Spirochaetales bacterium]